MQEDPSFISTISANVWKKWAPIILAYPELSDTKEEEDIHQNLVKIAYKHASSEIIQTLMILIDKECEKHNRIYITDKIKGCWDANMAKALLTKAKDKNLKPACMGSLLGVLIDNKIEGARSFAESLITLLSHCSGKERSRAIFAASVLITRAEDAGWSVVWPAIQQDTDFGREVITFVAHDGDLHNIGKRFIEDKLSDLYIWLVRQYPHDEDPKHEEGYWVGPKESVVKFRDSILSHLKQRGTHKACEAIRRISNELPELDWLK